MITATIVESNHLACFVALVTIKHFKLRRKEGKEVCLWVGAVQEGSVDIGVSPQKQVQKTQIGNSQNKNGQKAYENAQSHH